MKRVILILVFTILCSPIFIDTYYQGSSRYVLASIISIVIPITFRIVFDIKPFWFLLLSLPILVFSVIFTAMILEYNTTVTLNTWITIFDGNLKESSGFLKGVQSKTKCLVVFQILFYLASLFYFYKKTIPKLGNRIRIILGLVLIFFCVDFIVHGATKRAFPVRSTQSLVDYFVVKHNERKYFENKNHKFFNSSIQDSFNQSSQETLVIVVGETLRKDRTEYYGYTRPTTPLMKNEDILRYTDAISGANQTVNALQRAFTLADDLNTTKYWEEPSFIKAFKEVGFQTSWISTQPVYHKFINEISFIAKESDSIHFLKPINHDATLLEKYRDVLNNNAKKKLIIVHLNGCHFDYSANYPKSYNVFAKEISSNYKVNYLRQYDNAVLYNDYIVHELLSGLKAKQGNNSFIMFSDHGESLFDTSSNYFNHGSPNPSKSELDIPFILWFSDAYKSSNPHMISQVAHNLNKPIILNDFFHSVPSLYGITFDKLKPKNNFFGKEYFPKTNRKIINSEMKLLDYNSLNNSRSSIKY